MTHSRRAVLTACGAGLSALAGCSSLGGADESPTYDGGRLLALADEPVPRPPATFPVSVPDSMVASHRERAGELVERVPAEPAVPNGAVAERLREDRERVVDRLDGNDADGRPMRPLRRLRAARALREDAAAVEAAYRAATEAITDGAVEARRAQLRSTVLAFERDWTYRGDDPATAVVVHGAIEGLRLEARPGLAPERAFPAEPSSDVFRVGELVGDLEAGDAALSDAGRLRARYVDGASDPRPYRTPLSVASSRLWERHEQYSRDLNDYTDPDPEELPFDRSIEGTPEERLYLWAVDGVEIFRTDAEEARHRGDHATALMETGVSLTVLRALDDVVADIRNDRVDVPETTDDVVAARRTAIDALQAAWSTEPGVLATEVAHWSYRLLDNARVYLRGGGSEEERPSTGDAHTAWANYATATGVAAAVRPTVDDVQAALEAGTS